MRILESKPAGSLVHFWFNTKSQTYAPITLAGSPAVYAYRDSDLTQTTVGLTLIVDADGVTGSHKVVVDTSNAFYTVGSTIRVALSAGTADGVSLAGSDLAQFDLRLAGTGLPAVDASGNVNRVLASDETGLIADYGTLAADIVSGVWGFDLSEITYVVGQAGYRLDTSISIVTNRFTSARAAYLDNLNLGGLAASSSQVAALYNMSRLSLDVPPQILIPPTGTKLFIITASLYDADTGEMEAPDSTPTLTATLGDGTDVSARLSAASNPFTGVYRWTYTSSSAHAVDDQIRMDVVFTENGVPVRQTASSYTVTAITTDFTSSDRTALLDTQTKANTAATQATTAATQATTAATQSSAARVVTDKLNTTMESDGAVYRFTANALEVAPTGSGGGGAGGLTGASSVTITFTDATPAPIGPIRFTIVGQGSGMSDADGIAAFGLDDGTYTVVAAPKNSVLFPAAVLVVAGSTSLTIAGALPAIDPPVSPDQSTGFLVCYDAAGLPVVGATISFTMVRGPGSDGSSFGTQMTAVSGSMGLLQGSFVQGAIYEATRGTSGKSVRFAVPLTGTSFPIPETLGRD